MKTLLQIVPHAPGSFDGVGDYALNLARALSKRHSLQTVFGVADAAAPQSINSFELRQVDRKRASVADLAFGCDAALLHYVNYGYQSRGVPVWLPRFADAVRRQLAGPLLVVFHELYASGPPSGSAFWLQPLQKSIAARMAANAAHCLVSNEIFAEQLHRLNPHAVISVQPIPSSFGEPALNLAQIASRDPHRWVISGSAALLERSLDSFNRIMPFIPGTYHPRELLLIGGRDHPHLRAHAANLPGVRVTYVPEVTPDNAIALLATCSHGWLDYFSHAGVPLAMLLKSSSFANFCAHGIITVFPEAGSVIGVAGDALPGPYFVTPDRANLSGSEERGEIGFRIYEWYHRRAASDILAGKIAQLLGYDRTVELNHDAARGG